MAIKATITLGESGVSVQDAYVKPECADSDISNDGIRINFHCYLNREQREIKKEIQGVLAYANVSKSSPIYQEYFTENAIKPEGKTLKTQMYAFLATVTSDWLREITPEEIENDPALAEISDKKVGVYFDNCQWIDFDSQQPILEDEQ